jgi:hypothetical protein
VGAGFAQNKKLGFPRFVRPFSHFDISLKPRKNKIR